MPDINHTTPFDLLWLSMGVLALLFSALNLGEAIGEYRGALRADAATLHDPAALVAARLAGRWLVHVARQEVQQAMGMVSLSGLITFVGICALYLPPPPFMWISPLSFAAGVAMMAMAFVVVMMAWSEFDSRRQKPGARRGQ
jgi:hypothetical protein